MDKHTHIKTYKDLTVYQRTHALMVWTMEAVLPRLPESERHDLKEQIMRSCKAIPRLIAEGYAEKDQSAGFQQYLNAAVHKCTETMVSLEQCKDLYLDDKEKDVCTQLVEEYGICARQLHVLAMAWAGMKREGFGADTRPGPRAGVKPHNTFERLSPDQGI